MTSIPRNRTKTVFVMTIAGAAVLAAAPQKTFPTPDAAVQATAGRFGLIAWPADYGATGVETFIVNQLGVVYEKDLGAQTATAAVAIQSFDPDASWKKMR